MLVARNGSRLLTFGSLKRLSENATSSAVTGEPSENFASRRWKTIVLPPFENSHDFARPGCGSSVAGLVLDELVVDHHDRPDRPVVGGAERAERDRLEVARELERAAALGGRCRGAPSPGPRRRAARLRRAARGRVPSAFRRKVAAVEPGPRAATLADCPARPSVALLAQSCCQSFVASRVACLRGAVAPGVGPVVGVAHDLDAALPRVLDQAADPARALPRPPRPRHHSWNAVANTRSCSAISSIAPFEARSRNARPSP